MGTKEFEIICFADDAVLMREDEDNLQRLLYTFETVAKELSMIISIRKTKSLTISREPRRSKLAIHNKSVEQILSFKDLGVNITSSRKLKEVRTQTMVAAGVLDTFGIQYGGINL